MGIAYNNQSPYGLSPHSKVQGGLMRAHEQAPQILLLLFMSFELYDNCL